MRRLEQENEGEGEVEVGEEEDVEDVLRSRVITSKDRTWSFD